MKYFHNFFLFKPSHFCIYGWEYLDNKLLTIEVDLHLTEKLRNYVTTGFLLNSFENIHLRTDFDKFANITPALFWKKLERHAISDVFNILQKQGYFAH